MTARYTAWFAVPHMPSGRHMITASRNDHRPATTVVITRRLNMAQHGPIVRRPTSDTPGTTASMAAIALLSSRARTAIRAAVQRRGGIAATGTRSPADFGRCTVTGCRAGGGVVSGKALYNSPALTLARSKSARSEEHTSELQ